MNDRSGPINPMGVTDNLLEDVNELHNDTHSDSDNGNDDDNDGNDSNNESVVDDCIRLDCYPYTFSPLLLFAPNGYFDKGYSNYNAVVRYFSPVIGSEYNMLENVIYDRKNMQYEELLNHVVDRCCLVICCIDAHFTAFKFLSTNPEGNANVNVNEKKSKLSLSLVYYDPAGGRLQLMSAESARKFALFRLMKCQYGDNQHIIDNPNHYKGHTNATRQMIWSIWKSINRMEDINVNSHSVDLNLDRYVFFNKGSDPRKISSQLTGCTCYFQTFLFAVLCKVGDPLVTVSSDDIGFNHGRSISFRSAEELGPVADRICTFLFEFFAEDQPNNGGTLLMRPMTNNNFVLDFYGYRSSPYYDKMIGYFNNNSENNTNKYSDGYYDKQYHHVLQYYRETKFLHQYNRFSLGGTTESTPNTKTLSDVLGTVGAAGKLATSDYYKHRAANFMFGFNAGIVFNIKDFYQFNSLRKNQLLRFYEDIYPIIGDCKEAIQAAGITKYRDFYFMGQYEVGQQELIDIHQYTFMIDHCSLKQTDSDLVSRIHAVNQILLKHVFFSTNNKNNYDKILSTDRFTSRKKDYREYLDDFMSIGFFSDFIGLGFTDFNKKEKDVNAMTQTVFYDTEFMRRQQFKLENEFEKECLNQMARTNLSKYSQTIDGDLESSNKYKVSVKIGFGYTFSKYNTLMHFLNVLQSYWRNPDLSNISLFGKDIRSLLVVCSQKIFFEDQHCGFYHYGPFESTSHGGYSSRTTLDLAVATSARHAAAGVSRQKRNGLNQLIITDRVYEFHYLKTILDKMFENVEGKIKSDNEVINLCILALLLDFGLFERYVGLLNLPFLNELQHKSDTRELQVEVANKIYELDRKNNSNTVTRPKVEELLFEISHKFFVNKYFNVQSNQFKLIRELNSDPDYQSYVILVKIYMSLCQINKSVEVDYLKVMINGEFRIVIPNNYSKATSEYLEETTKHYTFSEREGKMTYDDLPVFDLRPHQPEINLYRVRLDPATKRQSMVKYIEITNVFRILDDTKEQYLIFIASNTLLLDAVGQSGMNICVNSIPVEVATVFFHDALSFIPCFQYKDSEDVILFASPQLKFHVDSSGQYCTDYYGMRHELIEYISSEDIVQDLNDEYEFKLFKLSELLTESKTVFYSPDYLLQVPNRDQLINLLDLALKLRNISFFILVLIYLRRSSVRLEYNESEGKTKYISGPWKEAILYVLGRSDNSHYDSIIRTQFFDLSQYKDIPLDGFVSVLCENFKRYQRFVDGQCQIIPTEKQKSFLKRIICGEECFHFSEVGSGKTKVILPLLCQAFLSNNKEVHKNLCRGGKKKDVLVVLVPEHLVTDARIQVFKYCLNLDFKEDYRVHDEIFVLLNENVQLGSQNLKNPRAKIRKHIFVTSFNQFKKALTYDKICRKVMAHREHFLVIADEVDDFLDRNKLVFNICSNKNNAFTRSTLDLFFDISRAAYSNSDCCPCNELESSQNPSYWKQLFEKFRAIHQEIQDASRSINKSFGIFNESTLRHCSTNISHDIEGYKSLIARPYESVNRAMPGSYYSDVERSIYLTYVILTEDISKYNALFQSERKFITFEYWNEHFIHQLDYDDLVYGHDSLSEICDKHPATSDGLAKFLYEIILRRMEIRDKSRSVNSIDIIFNFDCIGFTGTPFLDNYPTADYIRHERRDDIPNMINRDFYVYTNDELPQTEFERRFESFQGQNNNVMCRYVSSDFIRASTSEMETLETIFAKEEEANVSFSSMTIGYDKNCNAIVDLCGIFKRSSIQDVCSCIRKLYGPDKFHYLYHIDQSDNSDRVLCIKTGNDIIFDEEFYKRLCKTYGADVPNHIFFFVDNRNVIGKDIPFQLVYQRQYGKGLFMKSIVIAHDVDDFSKIWQAMGRSRTMNYTHFNIYKSDIPEEMNCEGALARNIRNLKLTRLLYVTNCDRKMAGNISSIYLTLIALFNLSEESFYYRDSIVNTFLEKMEMTISKSVSSLEKQLIQKVLGTPVLSHILQNILIDKFEKSPDKAVSNFSSGGPTDSLLEKTLCQIVKQKFEQRVPTGDISDQLILFLSGEQKSLLEISYTKQQQKQKQRQKNKTQDSDAMGIFNEKHQLSLSFTTTDYLRDTCNPRNDKTKRILTQPISVPILTIAYTVGTRQGTINVYPTLQFLYSHHIQQDYITDEVKRQATEFKESNAKGCFKEFLAKAEEIYYEHNSNDSKQVALESCEKCEFDIKTNFVRQSPQYTIAALKEGVYVIGMKDQFNIHDLETNVMKKRVQYIMDDIGFVLFDNTGSKVIDSFGPYFIEQYIIMDVLSKHEVSQNVLDYYCENKESIQRGLNSYKEKQGQGFVCWRFLINEASKSMAISNSDMIMSDDEIESVTSGSKRRRSDSSNAGVVSS